MAPGFTPGPWYVESDGHGPYVCADRQGRVCSIEPRGFKTNGSQEDWHNAHLISAAPKMFEVLQRAVAGADVSTEARALLYRLQHYGRRPPE